MNFIRCSKWHIQVRCITIMFNNFTTLHKQSNNCKRYTFLGKHFLYFTKIIVISLSEYCKGFHLITCKCAAIYSGFAFQYTCISFAVSDTFIKQHSMHMVDHRNSMLGCIALSIKEHTYIVHVSRNIIFFLVLRKDV